MESIRIGIRMNINNKSKEYKEWHKKKELELNRKRKELITDPLELEAIKAEEYELKFEPRPDVLRYLK